MTIHFSIKFDQPPEKIGSPFKWCHLPQRGGFLNPRLLRGRLIFHAPHMDCSLARSYPIFAWHQHVISSRIVIYRDIFYISDIQNFTNITNIYQNIYIYILISNTSNTSNCYEWPPVWSFWILPHNLRHQRSRGSKVWLGDSLGASRCNSWCLRQCLYILVIQSDLFGKVIQRDLLRGCWWSPTFGDQKVTNWIIWIMYIPKV